MPTVYWPARPSEKNATVWRILDLAGITNSVRLSRNYTRAGFVYLDGTRISMRTTVEIGRTFTLELRFPNGKTVTREIALTHRPPLRNPRSNIPTERNRKG